MQAGRTGCFYACGTWDVAAFMDDATFPLPGIYVDGRQDQTETESPQHGSEPQVSVSSICTENPIYVQELIQSLSTDLDGQKELCGETSGKSLQIPNIMHRQHLKDKVNDGTIPYASNVDVIFGYRK